MRNHDPKPRGKPLIDVLVPDPPRAMPVVQFQAVTFYDDLLKRQVIVLYSLGEDGIIREYSNNKWTPYPVTV